MINETSLLKALVYVEKYAASSDGAKYRAKTVWYTHIQ